MLIDDVILNLASSEAKTLEQYSDQTGRRQTDIVRELIRELPETPETNFSVTA